MKRSQSSPRKGTESKIPAKYVNGLRTDSKGTGMNPKDLFGMAKVPLGYWPETATVLGSYGIGFGAIDYGPYNWRVAHVLALVYLEAIDRHLKALKDGEDFDTKRGAPHICFILAGAAIYADAWLHGTLIDNRPVKGETGNLIEALNMKPGEPERTRDQIQALFEELLAKKAKEIADARR